MSDLPDNVVRLPVITKLDHDPDMVLREAIGQFESVIILGYDKDGEERCCASISYQKKLLEIPETWDGETHKKPSA